MSTMLAPVVEPKKIPHVGLWHFLGPLLGLRSGDLGRAVAAAQRVDRVFCTWAGPIRVVVVNDPEAIQDVLVRNHRSYRKDPGFNALRKFLGNGLLTNEGEHHLRQRRLIQPAFHKQRIAHYAESMVDYARAMSRGWQDGATVDMSAEMMSVALSIIGKTMFNADVSDDAERVAHALDVVIRYHDRYALPAVGKFFDCLPLDSTRRFHQALQDLDQTIYRFIREHEEAGEDTGDLLSMLLFAHHDDDGARMPLEQVKDEAITLFLAGHETTAIALTWTWYLLSQHPDVAARMHAEIDAVLEGGRRATADDLGQLAYTRRVFTEAMRLYPPAYGFGREALEENIVADFKVRKGDMVVVSPYVTQRMPEWFPEPERFDPDRWLPERAAHLHKFAYFPFGGGQRKCIGEPFAWMEGVLVLATLAQDWSPSLAPEARIGLEPRITLRPRYGMPMILHARKGSGAA
jgi:cytochrome P450